MLKEEEPKPQYYNTFKIPWIESRSLESEIFEAFNEKWFNIFGFYRFLKYIRKVVVTENPTNDKFVKKIGIFLKLEV
jgi:hypothetical protein